MKKVSIILLGLVSLLPCISYADFKKESFLPDFVWKKVLTDEEARVFMATDDTKADDMQATDLVLISDGKNSWLFAQLDFVLKTDEMSAFMYWSWNDPGQENKLAIADSSELLIRRLSPLWKEILQPNYEHQRLVAELEKFNATNRDISCNPHADARIVPSGSLIMVNGDLHGDMKALAENLVHVALTYNKFIDAKGKLHSCAYIAFMGDIGDRGLMDIQCWKTIFELANINPGKIVICRGNHEYDNMAKWDNRPDQSMSKDNTDKLSLPGFFYRFSYFITNPELNWNKMLTSWSQLPHFNLIGLRTPETTFVDFLMFVHGGFDHEWFMEELIKPTLESADNVITRVDIPAHVKVVEYNWADMVPVGFGKEFTEAASLAACSTWSTAELFEGARQAGEYRINHAAVKLYCDEVSHAFNEQICLSAILRGHDHNAVSTIKNIGRLINNPRPWKALDSEKKYPLTEHYDVYTFIAARNVASVGADSRYNAYGIIQAAENGRWYLWPHMFE